MANGDQRRAWSWSERVVVVMAMAMARASLQMIVWSCGTTRSSTKEQRKEASHHP